MALVNPLPNRLRHTVRVASECMMGGMTTFAQYSSQVTSGVGSFTNNVNLPTSRLGSRNRSIERVHLYLNSLMLRDRSCVGGVRGDANDDGPIGP